MSFAELMYHQSHQIPASDVPTSYFKHTRSKKFHCLPHTLLSLSKINIVFPGKCLISNKINNYKLDSVFLFGMDSSRIDEAEYYFESLVEPGTYIRLLVTHKSGKYVIQYPPQLGDQECNSTTHQLQNGLNLYHAWSKTNENGSHSLVFQTNEEVINCIIKPAPWTTSAWVVDLCNSILMHSKKRNLDSGF